VKPAAIALLVVKTAVRSRLLQCLAAILLFILVVMPLAVEGDGTAAGRARVLLEYTLGMSVAVLIAGALVFSCGAVAREIEERHIQLLAVKPVRAAQVWLGKWIGLLLINALLLAMVGVFVYGGIRWTLRSGRYSEAERAQTGEELLIARRLIVPVAEDVTAEAAARLAQLPAGAAEADPERREALLRMLGRRILAERATVAPGGSKTWVFRLPADIGTGRRARLRFRLAPTIEPGLISGSWRLESPPSSEGVTVSMGDALANGGYIDVPDENVSAPGTLRVVFRNGTAGQTGTAVFDIEEGLELLVNAGGFEANLLRSLFVLFCRLALLSALGLTAGCVFSSPVAGFLCVSIIVVAMMGHYVTVQSVNDIQAPHAEDAGGGERSRLAVFLQNAGESMVKRTAVVVEPVANLNPLGPLADGLLVSWAFAGRALVLLGVVYPGVLGAAGVWALWKRELALPGD